MALATDIDTDFDIEAFAMRVATLAHEHDQRDEADAKMRSAAAIRRWGSRVPTALRLTLDDLVARHRETWLRQAEAMVTVLDWAALTGGHTFHAIDFQIAGIKPDCGTLGFAVGPWLLTAADHLLPKRITSRPAAVVALNVDGLARACGRQVIDDADDEAKWLGHVVGAVACHEYAHLVAGEAAGNSQDMGRFNDVRLDEVAAAFNQSPAAPYKPDHHGPEWVRASAHLVYRGRHLAGHRVREALLRSDIDERLPGQADAVLDALRSELEADDGNQLIADIIRTAAPTEFVELFNGTPAASAA